jgi:pimeloyl-ACP methyl ester carboxylesterase
MTTQVARELALRVYPDIVLAAKAFGHAEGAGRRVLALHGWQDNAASFDVLAPLIVDGAAAETTVVALDFCGHGHSSWRPPSSPYSIVENVDHAIRAADALGWDKFTVVGHSMGGTVACALAGAFPERVERACLLEGYSMLFRDPSSAATMVREAVMSRKKLATKAPRLYSSVDAAARARIATAASWPGKQSLSMEAARALVTRGTKPSGEGFVFRHDLQLLARSFVHMPAAAAASFIHGITCDVMIVLAAQGGWPYDSETVSVVWGCVWGCAPHRPCSSLIHTRCPQRAMLNHFKRLDLHELEDASHHLHLDDRSARRAAELVVPFIFKSD